MTALAFLEKDMSIVKLDKDSEMMVFLDEETNLPFLWLDVGGGLQEGESIAVHLDVQEHFFRFTPQMGRIEVQRKHEDSEM